MLWIWCIVVAFGLKLQWLIWKVIHLHVFSSHVKPWGRSDSDWLHVGWARVRRRRLNFLETNATHFPVDMWVLVAHTSSLEWSSFFYFQRLIKLYFRSVLNRNLLHFWMKSKEMINPSLITMNVSSWSRRLNITAEISYMSTLVSQCKHTACY